MKSSCFLILVERFTETKGIKLFRSVSLTEEKIKVEKSGVTPNYESRPVLQLVEARSNLKNVMSFRDFYPL